jgi:hypothetical protein
MADPTRFVGHDSDGDSDSAHLVHHHKPPFQTRAGTMVNASKHSEYDSDSNDLNHHRKPQFMTSENNWLLKYQKYLQFYLTHRHCDVSRKAEMATLADWVLYQRTKFKSDHDTFDSHRLHLLKVIKFHL